VSPDWPFQQIWLVDFEFCASPGERPDPVCLCALELRTGQLIRQWRDEFGDAPPYATGPEALFVAFYASAELGCHLALGWPQPARVLDLFVEFRNRTNGLPTPSGAGLIGALTYFGLDAIGAVEKDELRQLVLRGGPWSADEQAAILDYCEADVRALQRLLPRMAAQVDLPRALLRGRYMSAVARMEWAGTPIDVERLGLLLTHWEGIQVALITAIDVDYGVYEDRTFKADRFAAWLARAGIPWPRLDSGRLDLTDSTFRQMARVYPSVSPLRELRSSLSEMRLNDLAVGHDGRNRTLLSPFRAKSGRNAPSNTKFIFGPSVWLRGLIRPPVGYGIAYIDWEQQEFGIGAALSGDRLMTDAYFSGDPYLRFAYQAGAVPADATKHTHPAERELFKTTVLGVQYGMEYQSLALRLNKPPALARDLLRAHRQTYRTFWAWSDAAVDAAMLYGSIRTVFGWTMHVTAGANTRSLRNFPMQANGGELLRLACCLATEQGVEVAAPIHDAVLIVAPLDRLDHDVAVTGAAMAEASREVLAGFELRTDAKLVRYPDRYSDPRGVVMWQRVMKLIAEREGVARLAA
jgi:DNA polymerase family A